MKTIIYLQWLCIILVIFGIGIELYYRADLGFVLVTLGSLLMAVVSKIENRLLTFKK
jgi:hypothetical protein